MQAGNFFLEVKQPLTGLAAFTRLKYLDLRAVHMEEASAKFWSPAKCSTMQHVATAARSLRRRNRHVRVLYDTS